MSSNAIYPTGSVLTNQAYSPSNQAYSPLRIGYAAEQLSHRLAAALRPVVKSMVTALTDSSNLRVWASKDAAGQTVWNANDRITGRTIRDVSDSELRIWLEHRYTA